jgi:hypothetical protein
MVRGMSSALPGWSSSGRRETGESRTPRGCPHGRKGVFDPAAGFS